MCVCVHVLVRAIKLQNARCNDKDVCYPCLYPFLNQIFVAVISVANFRNFVRN